MSFPLPPNVLPAGPQLYTFPRLQDGDGLEKNWLDKDGNFQTEEIDLSMVHQTPWFVDLCQRFGLAHSGTKPARRERLIKFSQAGTEQWKANLLPPTRIPHKGVRDGAITKRKLTRLGNRIHDVSIPASNPKGVLVPMSRSVDTRSQAKVDDYIPWAERRMAKIAKEEEHAQNLRHTHLPEPGVNNVRNINVPNTDPLASPDFFQRLASIVEEKLVAHRNSSPLSLPSTASTVTPHPSMDFDSTIMGLTASSPEAFSGVVDRPDSPILPSLRPMQMTSPSTLLSPPAPPVSECNGHTPVSSDDTTVNPIQCSLVFADGQVLTVRQGDVPPTKPFSYTTNIQSLLQCWDDCNPDWAPPVDYPIVIHGRPIPIKYYKDIYKLNKKTGNEWEKLRSVWLDWKNFVEAYQASPTPEDFWDEFSDSRGQRLKFAPIKRTLLTRRADANLVLAQQALTEYGDDFINHFSYKADGKLKRMTDVPAIVRRYKEMKGISCSEDD